MLGIHVNKSSSTLYNAILKAHTDFQINSAQIFVYGPQSMIPIKLDPKKLRTISTRQIPIKLVIHSSYPSISIWNISKHNISTKESQRQIANILDQLIIGMQIQAMGLVLHIAKYPAASIAETMLLLKPLAKKTQVPILLEMVSSKSSPNTYETPEKINNLSKLIDNTTNTSWWGWCIDTAHLWGAGIDIRYYKQMAQWLNQIRYKDKIKLFHLNGSSVIRGSGKDKHEIVFSQYDKIWHNISPKKSGVYAIVKFAQKRQIPIICEIKRGTLNEIRKGLNILKSLLTTH